MANQIETESLYDGNSADRYPKPAYWLAILGLILILAGAALAQMIRTADGTTVHDIRFAGADGTQMSALLYVPAGATEASPAPGILAVHGYINSRETQDGFAIEFARRGYVVLSLDQTGHGYSGGPAFANGFGGPDGLRHLRSLPMVDTDQIGLEGHSMGGWTILAAASALPDAYQSMVLVGSSTGAPFAQDGSMEWPRNLSLIFSEYDEFAKLMWDVDRALDTPASPKLRKIFGTGSSVVEGQIYGAIEEGTARVLHQPATTHPGDHLSPDAIGHAADWFAATLKGGTPRPADDQTWYWKELGTGIGLIGFVMLLLGTFDLLIRWPVFAALRDVPEMSDTVRDQRWQFRFWLVAILPALTFFPVFIAAGLALPGNAVLPQTVTTQVMCWALFSAAITVLMNRFGLMKRFDPARGAQSSPNWMKSISIAAATLIAAYLVLLLVHLVFQTDLRFWVVAIKFPSARQFGIAAIYLLPITAAFLVSLKPLCTSLVVAGDGTVRRYATSILALVAGFVLLLGTIYGIFFATGTLVTGFDPLSTVIALQFIPLLCAIAIITTFCWYRTGSHRAGALIVGGFVTLYVVAGTATQV